MGDANLIECPNRLAKAEVPNPEVLAPAWERSNRPERSNGSGPILFGTWVVLHRELADRRITAVETYCDYLCDGDSRGRPGR